MDRNFDYTFVDYGHSSQGTWEGGWEGLGILDEDGKEQATGNRQNRQVQ